MITYWSVDRLRIFLARPLVDKLAALLGRGFTVHLAPPVVLGLGVYRTVRWQRETVREARLALRILDSFTGFFGEQFEYTYLVTGSEISLSSISSATTAG